MTISSRSNPTIKEIRALHNRKARDRSGLCFAEGIRAVADAIQLGAGIETLVVAPDLLTSRFGQQLVESQAQRGVNILTVTHDVFESISLKDNPQGMAAVVRQQWERLADATLGGELCRVALDSVQDPGNLGALLRTSEAVGGGGVILLGHTCDPYDPSAIRASTGAIFSQRLARASLPELARWKREHGYTVVGASGAATTDYQSVSYEPPLILLMGSERQGLSKEHLAVCDTVVRIPMVGRSDSLNLAVATGVVMYEVFNQTRKSG